MQWIATGVVQFSITVQVSVGNCGSTGELDLKWGHHCDTDRLQFAVVTHETIEAGLTVGALPVPLGRVLEATAGTGVGVACTSVVALTLRATICTPSTRNALGAFSALTVLEADALAGEDVTAKQWRTCVLSTLFVRAGARWSYPWTGWIAQASSRLVQAHAMPTADLVPMITVVSGARILTRRASPARVTEAAIADGGAVIANEVAGETRSTWLALVAAGAGVVAVAGAVGVVQRAETVLRAIAPRAASSYRPCPTNVALAGTIAEASVVAGAMVAARTSSRALDVA